MNSTRVDGLRAAKQRLPDWMVDRSADFLHGLSDIEAHGRHVYHQLSKAGHDVVARTPQELRQLALASLEGRLPQAVGEIVGQKIVSKVTGKGAQRPHPQGAPESRGPTRSPPTKRSGPQLEQQARAAGSGFVDEATFGLADPTLSALNAVRDGGFAGFADRYSREREQHRQDDARDDAQYGLARNTGRVAGFGATLAATGGIGVAGRVLRGAQHVGDAVRVARLAPGGLTLMATTGGAASGLAGQVVGDIASRRLGSFGDYTGAALGGAIGGLAARAPIPGSGALARATRSIVPRIVGGVEGAATSAAQSVLNGREISAVDLAEAARMGVVGAEIGNVAGRNISNGLSRGAKGKLGEGLSATKSVFSGDGLPIRKFDLTPQIEANFPRTIGGGPQRRVYLSNGRYTVADHVTKTGKAVEAKFDKGAELRPNQIRAQDEFGDLYQINHFMPSDIGLGGAVGMGGLFGGGIRPDDD